MARGRPSKWAQLHLDETFYISRTGLSIKVWDKYGRKHKGNLVISVGGLRWYPYRAKNPSPVIGWDKLAQWAQSI